MSDSDLVYKLQHKHQHVAHTHVYVGVYDLHVLYGLRLGCKQTHTYEVEMDLQSVWEQTPSKTYVHAHIWFPFGKGNSQLGLLSRSTPIMDLCSQAVEAAGSRLGLKPRLLCPSQRVLLRRAGISA